MENEVTKVPYVVISVFLKAFHSFSWLGCSYCLVIYTSLDSLDYQGLLNWRYCASEKSAFNLYDFSVKESRIEKRPFCIVNLKRQLHQ